MEVHLSEDLEKLVQEKVESGRYRSPSEVIRRALLVLDEWDQELDTMRRSGAPTSNLLDAWNEARLRTASAAVGSDTTPEKAAEAWEDFFRLGDTLAVSDSQESGTLTAAVLAIRR